MNICFVGGGNMAAALIGGMLKQESFSADHICVVEIDAKNREKLRQEFAVRTCEDLAEGIRGSSIVVLAVKPQQLCEIAKQLATLLDGQLLISIAAGIRAQDLARWSGSKSVVRCMPNTPALIGSGITGLFALPGVTAQDRAVAQDILGAVGSTLWVDEEGMLDAVTAISGSGPAYVFYFIEALERAALELGFSHHDASKLSVETFLGASRLAASSSDGPGTLRAKVTSKNGTTERALQSMASNSVAEHIIQAAKAAESRSRELGRELGQA